MKYCVSSRQPISVLRKTDEIKVEYRDRNKMFDFIEELPDKTYILEVPKDTENIDWTELQMFSEKVNFILCLQNLKLIEECFTHNIKFYWGYPIISWYELSGIIAFNPCYLLLGAPMSFMLNKVKRKTDIPIRLCPNLAYDGYIPRVNGLKGTWVRPEDIGVYEQWVDTFEFAAETLDKEATLLHIYKDNGNWPGNLNLLLTNFRINVDNRGIPDELGETRANCGQRCLENGTCHFCETSIQFSEALRKEVARRKREEREDAEPQAD